MGQHWALNQIANSVNSLDIGLEVFIDENSAASLVGLDADLAQSQSLGERPTADGDQHLVALETHILTVMLGIDDNLSALRAGAGDFRLQLKRQPLLE